MEIVNGYKAKSKRRYDLVKKKHLHGMRVSPGLLDEGLDHPHGVVVYSEVTPSQEHETEESILHCFVDVDCHLEHGDENVSEVHHDHHHRTNWHEVAAIRIQHQCDSEDMMEEKLSEISASTVEGEGQNCLVAVIGKLYHIQVIQESR